MTHAMYTCGNIKIKTTSQYKHEFNKPSYQILARNQGQMRKSCSLDKCDNATSVSLIEMERHDKKNIVNKNKKRTGFVSSPSSMHTT